MAFQNHCLQEAERRLRGGQLSILSLDIFDTVVWRSFPQPADLFFALGSEVLARHWVSLLATPESFATARIDAEARARRQKKWTAEVTLEEIYSALPDGLLETDRGKILALELEIEAHATHPHPEIVALAALARSLKMQVALVSDTYFPESHLRRIVPFTPDYLIASCEFGLSKVDGLHRALCYKSGVPPGRILHVGDNMEADVNAPARFGVVTLSFPKFPAGLEQAVQKELPATRSERAPLVAHRDGDYGLTSLRSRAAGTNGNAGDPFRSWGAAVLGPAMAGFCDWVLAECDRERIPLALCPMREGRILSRMLRALRPEFACPELFISRYAAVLASIFEGTKEELTQFLARPSAAAAEKAVAPLGLAPEQLGLAPGTAIGGANAGRVAELIASNFELRTTAVAASRRHRVRLIRHLLKIAGGEVPDRAAIVDLGYAGTIQACLQRIFDHESILVRTHGLYLVTNTLIGKVHETGASAAGYLSDNGQPTAISHSFTRSPEVFEQALMCRAGSTLGYTDAGDPILDAVSITAPQLDAIEKVQAGAMDFLRAWVAEGRRPAPDPLKLREFIRAIVVRALTSPTPEELKHLGQWHHDENFGSKKSRSLVACSYSNMYLRHMSAHQLASLRSSDVYWIFGLAHALGPVPGEAVKAIYLRRVAPEAFNASIEGPTLTFFWDDGRVQQTACPMTFSQNGTAWHRFSLAVGNGGLHRLGLRLSGSTAPVCFSGAALRVARTESSEHVIWSEPARFRDAEGRILPNGRDIGNDTSWFIECGELSSHLPAGSTLHVDLFFSLVAELEWAS